MGQSNNGAPPADRKLLALANRALTEQSQAVTAERDALRARVAELEGERDALAARLQSFDPQPAPSGGEGDVWAGVIARTTDPRRRALYTARRAFGIQKYGVPLGRNDGRDAERDFLEELVDAVVYAFRLGWLGFVPVLETMIDQALDLLEVSDG